MNTRIAATALAVLGGASSLLLPTTGHAGNVGYYGDDCYNTMASTPAIISAAGHTPVAVATLDAASLAGLQGLFINGCTFATNAAVDAAVNNGMVLIWHDPNWGSQNSKSLPGGQTVPYTEVGGINVDFPAGSPVTTGPGGTVDNGSLDNGNSSTHGFVAVASLPAGSQVLANDGNAADAITFAYNTGAGKVAFSTIPLTCYFAGGPCSGNQATLGMQAYAKNVIAWAMTGGVTTTCASEGYTGTQLTWCQNICEKGYTGATLSMWIRRWLGRWHDLPYCAANPTPPPPPPPGLR